MSPPDREARPDRPPKPAMPAPAEAAVATRQPKPIVSPFHRQATPAHDRIVLQRNAVRSVRAKLESFLASLEGLEDEALIRAIQHFETYGYSTVTGVPRIEIPMRRDQYDQAYLQAMKAFIEAKCAILLRICDREELQLELAHPSHLIGTRLEGLAPTTSGQVQAMIGDLTKEIDHMTRSLVQTMDSRLLG